MGKSTLLQRIDCADICTLRITRPHALNALNVELLQNLESALEEVFRDATLRALVITAEGEKAFCAGADLKERQGMTLDDTRNFVRLIGHVFRKLELIEIPTIAALNGVAFGGGLELALACDFRVAVKSAKMGLTECSLGIIPGAGGTQRLPRLVGMAAAKKMILCASVIGAQEALSIGLLDAVAEDRAQLLSEVQKLVDGFKKCAPLSVRAAKKAMQLGSEVHLEQGLELEYLAYESIIESSDRVEGLQAFSEKRAPRFEGR